MKRFLLKATPEMLCGNFDGCLDFDGYLFHDNTILEVYHFYGSPGIRIS